MLHPLINTILFINDGLRLPMGNDLISSPKTNLTVWLDILPSMAVGPCSSRLCEERLSLEVFACMTRNISFMSMDLREGNLGI